MASDFLRAARRPAPTIRTCKSTGAFVTSHKGCGQTTEAVAALEPDHTVLEPEQAVLEPEQPILVPETSILHALQVRHAG